ncbi:hypothetical protein K6119_08130 [Paracrocinitomix mangrovi]|uniref:hypothetical protein n=1 Tax=Paracrocinitomix mangrovi TaxID=2862509 RepID=UPI001C8D6B59|nr:hypothetical protein [Paracrocinitomix mangrovi]UKN03480.1 hypothetical protein K6119_08130 [Paracrocinitomix mangrovi]
MIKWVRIIICVLVGIPTIYNLSMFIYNGPYHLPLRIILPVLCLVALFVKRKEFRYVLIGLSLIGIGAFIYTDFFAPKSASISGFYFTHAILYDLGIEQKSFVWYSVILVPVLTYPMLLIAAVSHSARKYYGEKLCIT